MKRAPNIARERIAWLLRHAGDTRLTDLLGHAWMQGLKDGKAVAGGAAPESAPVSEGERLSWGALHDLQHSPETIVPPVGGGFIVAWAVLEIERLRAMKRLSATSDSVDMVLVPREPTEAMIFAGFHQIDWDRSDQKQRDPSDKAYRDGTGDAVGTTPGDDVRDCWSAMLAASQTGGANG